MKDSLKPITFGVLIGLLLIVIGWPGLLFAFGCSSTDSCTGEHLPPMTSIPTLLAATLPPAKVGAEAAAAAPRCHIATVDLIGAWVTAGASETKPFPFTDSKGVACVGTFKDDVQRLFVTSNLWYAGAPACITCHFSDVKKATKNMDLSSYAGIIAGAERANGEAKGLDILGGGNWDNALLHKMLYAPDGKTQTSNPVRPAMPLGRPADVPASGPIIAAGSPTSGGTTAESNSSTPEATPTSAASVEEIARPSNPGGPGDAVGLTGDAKSGATVFAANCVACHGPQGTQGINNPGSDDGSVPPLNPIDSTLVSADYKTFATNLDLFIQHGSKPAGPGPAISMPAWGDQNMLTQQQIADVIAFLISLNK